MKYLLITIMLIGLAVSGCKKSNSTPSAPVDPRHRILANVAYVAQTYIVEIDYNGQKVDMTLMPGYEGVSYDSLITVAGSTVDVIVSGGGGGDFINISDFTSAYPVHETQAYIPPTDNMKYTLSNVGATDIVIFINK